MPSQTLIDSAIANSENATLVANNLADGTYWIVEMTAPLVEITYWNPDNVSCNGILNIYNTSQFNNVSIELNNVSSSAIYKLYNPNNKFVYGTGSVYNNKAYINVTGLLPGTYHIVETGLEQIEITNWNPSNVTYIGRVQIINSTPLSTWRFTALNHTFGALALFNPSTSETITLPVEGLADDIYYLMKGFGSTSNVPSTYIVGSLVVATVISGSLIYKRRKHD